MVGFASLKFVTGLLVASGSIAFSCFFKESFMGNKLYVGNLPYSFRDEDLQPRAS